MNTPFRWMIAAALLSTAACATSQGESIDGAMTGSPPKLTSTAQLLGPNGEMRGTATLTEMDGTTRVQVTVEDMAPGTYGMHIHTTGACTPPDFTSAGPHYNPTGRQHGTENPQGSHKGDLPNVTVDATGRGSIDQTVEGVTLAGDLMDADGSAIVLHAGPDDYRTDPSGNSGGRIACGVIARR